MTLNRPVPVVLGLSALYGATYAVIRWLCEGTPLGALHDLECVDPVVYLAGVDQ